MRAAIRYASEREHGGLLMSVDIDEQNSDRSTQKEEMLKVVAVLFLSLLQNL